MELNELSALSYAVVDCEATGTRVNRDRVMEIAVIHVDDGVARTALESLVDPQRPIAPWVSRLTGIRRDMVDEAVKFARRVLTHLPRRNLDAVAWHYDVPIVGRHRAGGDARATAQVLIRLLADARRQDVETWDQLQDLIRRPPNQPRGWSYLPRPVSVEAIA